MSTIYDESGLAIRPEGVEYSKDVMRLRKSLDATWEVELFDSILEQHKQAMAPLVEAAQSVVDRWDSPLWKDLPHTGEFIDKLRQALAAHSSNSTASG